MERHENWMQWSFDDGPIYGPKLSKDAVFKLHFKKGYPLKEMTYHEALFYNANMMAENYTQPFDVLLSGGIDSEVVVRMFHKLGVKQNVYTFRLEDNLNKVDVDFAKSICNELGIKLNLIDFNLKKWFENEAEAIYKKTWFPVIEKLVRFSYFEYLDNVIIMGEGEPYWRRENAEAFSESGNRVRDTDYSTKSEWRFHLAEYDFMNSLYGKLTNRTIIGEWYLYVPEVIMSFHKLPVIKRLLNDEIKGKISSWSSRTEIHQEIFPTIRPKPKLVGYEGLGEPTNKPAYMIEFQQTVMSGTSNCGYTYSVEELENLLK